MSPAWLPRLRSALDEPSRQWDDHTARDIPTYWPDFVRDALTSDARSAAVLILLIARGDAASVLLTLRSSKLKNHAGQVSFPGGGREPGDKDAVATALRETQEEVGIAPGAIEVLGQMGPMPTVSGYVVTPIVGWLGTEPRLRLDSAEVEDSFEVPLDWLCTDAAFQLVEREFEGSRFAAQESEYAGHRIWGATAYMLHQLINLIK